MVVRSRLKHQLRAGIKKGKEGKDRKEPNAKATEYQAPEARHTHGTRQQNL
jgi:hypothetical protein